MQNSEPVCGIAIARKRDALTPKPRDVHGLHSEFRILHDRVHRTAASSTTRIGCGRGVTSPATPSGSVQHGPVVWPDGNPNSTGPRTSAVSLSMTCRAV